MKIRNIRKVIPSLSLKCFKYSYFIFFAKLIAYIGTNNAISDNVSNLVKEVCLGGVVYGGHTFSSFPSNSCCSSCDFDQSCIERKTCCDDRWQHIKDFKAQTCLPGMRERSLKRSVIGLQENYLVRAHCPRSFSNYDVRNKCELDEPFTLEDIPFVSSKNGEVIYKNRHCAFCHGEINPVVWKLYFDHTCIRRVFLPRYYSEPFQNASMINEKLINSCTLYYERPNIASTNWKRLTCALDSTLISNCPEMTSTEMAPGSVEVELNDLCLKDKSGLSVSPIHKRWYSNVYCYLCNNRNSGNCYYNNPHKVVPSISIFLDMSFLRTSSSTQQEKQCRDDHFYDSFFDTCRQINCQMFETAVAGRCVSFVLKSKLNYAFDFEYVPTQPFDTTALTTISKKLSFSFPHKFGFGKCTVCNVKTNFNMSKIHHGDLEIVTLYQKFIFSTSPTCNWTFLHSRAEWLHRTEYLSMTLGNVTFKIKFFSSPEEYLIKMRQLGKIDGARSCPFYYPGGFSCPWTTLSSAEIDELRKETGNSTTLVIRKNKNGNVELCIDAYKSFLRNTKSYTAQTKYCIDVMILTLLVAAILKDYV